LTLGPTRGVVPWLGAPGSYGGSEAGYRVAGQSVKFLLVGAAGYAVNIAGFAVLRHAVQLEVHVAAVGAFVLSLLHNYTLNRRWTFAAGGRSLRQFLRFVSVSLATLGLNLLLLHPLLGIGLPDVLAQAVAIAVGTPASFMLNKRWSFRLFDPREELIQDGP
jgi:putative flippase GtrA